MASTIYRIIIVVLCLVAGISAIANQELIALISCSLTITFVGLYYRDNKLSNYLIVLGILLIIVFSIFK